MFLVCLPKSATGKEGESRISREVVCHVSTMKDNTDRFMRRKGGFRDQILATERCLEAGLVFESRDSFRFFQEN